MGSFTATLIGNEETLPDVGEGREPNLKELSRTWPMN